MEKLMNIAGFEASRNLPYKHSFEGEIIVKDDNTFEGIVSNRLSDVNNDMDKYVSGTINLDSLFFELKNNDNDVVYKALGDGFGNYKGLGEEDNDCLIRVRKPVVDKEITNMKMSELKEIISIHRDLSVSERENLTKILK